MPSLIQFARDQHTNLALIPKPQDCNGATYIVTGSNTGIGFECAKHLVQLYAKRVILGVRTPRKGEEAKAKIEMETGRKGVLEVWHFDATSYDSVKDFAKKVHDLDRVDAIIANAGVALDKYSTAEGLETTLTVNDVSTMLLAVLVLPKLQESARTFNISTNLVVVGSNVAFDAKGVLENVDGDILDGLSRGIDRKRYQISKLIQLYAVRELAEMRPSTETGVTINFASPGLCNTGLTRHVGLAPTIIIGTMRVILGRTAEEGSRVLLYAAIAGEESHGKYLSECEIRDYRVEPWITNDAGQKMQKRVWASVSQQLNAIQPECI